MDMAGIDVPVEAVRPTPGRGSGPTAQRCARQPGASVPGWRRCGPGELALAAYLERADLLAAVPV